MGVTNLLPVLVVFSVPKRYYSYHWYFLVLNIAESCDDSDNGDDDRHNSKEDDRRRKLGRQNCSKSGRKGRNLGIRLPSQLTHFVASLGRVKQGVVILMRLKQGWSSPQDELFLLSAVHFSGCCLLLASECVTVRRQTVSRRTLPVVVVVVVIVALALLERKQTDGDGDLPTHTICRQERGRGERGGRRKGMHRPLGNCIHTFPLTTSQSLLKDVFLSCH